MHVNGHKNGDMILNIFLVSMLKGYMPNKYNDDKEIFIGVVIKKCPSS